MHRILRQTFEISTATEAGATRIQSRLSQGWQSSGLAALEQVLATHDSDAVLRIDRLELDLGRITGPGWLDELLTRLRAAAEDGILSAIRPGTAAADSPTRHPKARVTGISSVPMETSRVGALGHYLTHGYLPWASDLQTSSGWIGRAIADLPPAARAPLIALAAATPDALSRLIISLDPEQLQHLLDPVLPAALQGRLPALAMALFPSEPAHVTALSTVRSFWHPLFALASSPTQPAALTEATTRSQLCTEWLPLFTSEMRGRAAGDTLRAAARHLPVAYQETLQSLRRAASRTPKGTVAGTANPPATATDTAAIKIRKITRTDGGIPTPPSPPDAKTPAERAHGTTDHTDPNPIFVSDAGLVLVHPFLPELFGRTGLCEDNAFIDREARNRATRLLGHVVFGTPMAEEADLVTAKILTGLPANTLLLPDPLSKAACEAADAMLMAMLGHWTTLNSSSPDLLRDAFLRRAGVLKVIESGPVLQVETQAQDVLLQSLPWGFGTISLPWMAAPLAVRWID